MGQATDTRQTAVDIKFLVPLGTRSGFHKCVTLFRVRKLSGVPSDPVRVFFAFVAVLHALRLKSEHRYHGGNFNI